jgi:ADP-ribosylglycohydrolase
VLFEIAIGDAYGAGFEFCSRQKIERSNTLASYVDHELGIAAGCYTDDTQMSIAISEVLLSEASATSATFADAFVRCYKRDRRKGYAKGMQALLDECPDGSSLRSRIKPESRRNGAAMRSVPLGLIPDKSLLLSVAEEQAAITHNTAEGILSSRVVALSSHLLLYEQAKLSNLPKVPLIRSAALPVGAPPPLGPIRVQNSVWLAWPPPLLRTAVRMSSGTLLMSRSRSSMLFDWSSGYFSSAAFRFVTYAL